jgi:ABC-type nickel/cobalt efflux system permease component RcnA
MLTSHIKAVASNAESFGFGLIGVSFLYGAFHAIGPGHGKAVIVTYLGTHKESLRSGIVISLIAAILQSIVAIILVSTLAIVLKFNFHEVQQYGNNIAYVSYALIVALGVVLLVTSLRRIAKHFANKKQLNQHHHEHGESHSHGHSHDHSHDDDHSHHAHAETHDHDHGHHHDHGSNCGCTHAHVPEKDQSLWKTITVILSMGLRPCTGAIVVLVYAHLVGVYNYGIAATLMMGVGTGLSVSLIAIAAQHARSWLEKFAESSGSSSILSSAQFSNYVKFIGGVFLVALGWSLYIAASTSTAHYHLP